MHNICKIKHGFVKCIQEMIDECQLTTHQTQVVVVNGLTNSSNDKASAFHVRQQTYTLTSPNAVDRLDCV